MILCAKFGWNRPSCSGEEDEKVIKFTTTTPTTDSGQIWAKNYRLGSITMTRKWGRIPSCSIYSESYTNTGFAQENIDSTAICMRMLKKRLYMHSCFVSISFHWKELCNGKRQWICFKKMLRSTWHFKCFLLWKTS